MDKKSKKLTEAMEEDSELKALREEAWDEEAEKYKPMKITFAVDVNIPQAYVVAKMSGSVKLSHEASNDIPDALQGRFEFEQN